MLGTRKQVDLLSSNCATVNYKLAARRLQRWTSKCDLAFSVTVGLAYCPCIAWLQLAGFLSKLSGVRPPIRGEHGQARREGGVEGVSYPGPRGVRGPRRRSEI